MAYATTAQLVEYLSQLDGDDTKTEVLQSVIDRAAAIINTTLGVSADLTPATPGTQVIYGDGTHFLCPSGPVSDVTLVEAPEGYTVPTYRVIDGVLASLSPEGKLCIYYGGHNAWHHNVPYTVHATYGYSDQIMTALEQANLEIAVNLWRFKDSGGAQQIGAETGIINVRQQFSPMVNDILEQVERERRGVTGGVW